MNSEGSLTRPSSSGARGCSFRSAALALWPLESPALGLRAQMINSAKLTPQGSRLSTLRPPRPKRRTHSHGQYGPWRPHVNSNHSRTLSKFFFVPVRVRVRVIPDFGLLRAALLYLRGCGFQDTVTIDFDSPVISARQSLTLSYEFAKQILRAVEDAMRSADTHAQLQPLQGMSDTVNGHIGVIVCCFRYFMIPDEVREVFWRAQWSDTDSYTDSDTDSDSDWNEEELAECT
jgi:hypothetical protein